MPEQTHEDVADTHMAEDRAHVNKAAEAHAQKA